MESVYLALGIVIALGAGLVLGYVVRGYWGSQAVKHAQEKAGRIIAEAQARQKDLILQGKEEQVRMQREAEEDARAKRAEMSGLENRLLQRDAQLDERSEMLEERDRKLLDRERELDVQREELSRAKLEQIAALERVSEMSREEAKAQAPRGRSGLRPRTMPSASPAPSSARPATRPRRRRATCVVTAIQRVMADHTAEMTVTVVPAAVGRDEGPHHRPRGPQHPGPRAGDRAST